ncbi:MAG: homoserine dehydrogenase [Chitinophagaceae bacterium]
MKNIKVGLFGFGVVGEGIYQVLASKPNIGIEINKIVIKHPDKKRNAPSSFFTTNRDHILQDNSIDLVVELIDDADAALDIVSMAMRNGKSVISANKKMIANHHELLIALARKNHVSFLYEAAVCGSIPIVRNLEEYFDNDFIHYIKAIVNGSTNYILTQMYQYGMEYNVALKQAQEQGFAESNPILDVEGLDALDKTKIIALHAFGKIIQTEDILCKGITSLTVFDFTYAKEKNYVIKLISKSVLDKEGNIIYLSVFPTFISKEKRLSFTDNEYNGVIVGSALADEQYFYGKGAGRFPTSSAVLSDISAYKYDYKYAYKKGISHTLISPPEDIKVYISFDKNITFKNHIFTSIEECYKGKGKTYMIGLISFKKLTTILKDKDISIVLFDD